MKKRITLLLSLLMAMSFVFVFAPVSAFAKSDQIATVVTPGGCNTTSDSHLRVGACISRTHIPSNPDFFTPDGYVTYYPHTSPVSGCTVTLTLAYSNPGGIGGGIAGQTSFDCSFAASYDMSNIHYSSGFLGNSSACSELGCTFFGEMSVSIYYSSGASDYVFQVSPGMEE